MSKTESILLLNFLLQNHNAKHFFSTSRSTFSQSWHKKEKEIHKPLQLEKKKSSAFESKIKIANFHDSKHKSGSARRRLLWLVVVNALGVFAKASKEIAVLNETERSRMFCNLYGWTWSLHCTSSFQTPWKEVLENVN